MTNEGINRKLIAFLSADVKDYSRLMGQLLMSATRMSAMKTLKIVAILFCIVLSANGLATDPGSYYVTAIMLNVRLGNSTSAKITNRLHNKQKVDVYEVKNGWARISKYYDGSIEGLSGSVARWVSAKYLTKIRLPDQTHPEILNDNRINGIPNAGQYRITERDVHVLNTAAKFFLKTGICDHIEYGHKSTSEPSTYYLNCAGGNHYFKPSAIPGLK